MAFADLELQNEDDAIDDHNNVDSLPETWNGVLEVRGAASAAMTQDGLKEVDFNEPRVPLGGFNWELIAHDEPAKNLVDAAVEELVD
jgi:hypothetical protein